MLKTIIASGVAVNVGYLLNQVPTIVLIVFITGCFVLAALVLFNESACNRLIRVLKVLLGRSDEARRQKRR
jgi:hypothetical protein